jgi:hypothetical protein
MRLDTWPLRRSREGMRWASIRVVGLPVLLAAATGFFSLNAGAAMTCESARPTDAAGSAGVSYGSAKVSFFDAASGHARVHYALSGPHAPPAASTLEDGVPDAVVIAAQAAEAAFVKFNELSYLPPLDDGDSPCASNGGSDAVDIYLLHFAAADGQTVPDHCQEGSPKRCAGFVLVENDFKGGGYANVAEGMRTVVPHELFHLVQDAYDADVERWWAEGSAQWAAKQVYPDLKDLERFLPAYFKNPWRPLNVPPNGVITDFLYATAIWPVFLQQRFDSSIVREVYEASGQGDGVLPTTDIVLQAHDSSLAQEFLQFAAYNATTDGRGVDAAGYTDGANYPAVPVKALSPDVDPLVSDVDSGLGAYYYSLLPDAPLRVELDADPERMTALLIPSVDGKLDLTGAQPLPATVEGEATIVVASQSLLRTDAPFTLRSAATTGGAQAGAKGDSGPDSSGCSVGGRSGKNAANGGVALGFVVILLGRCRAGRRPRKGR